MWLMKTKHLVRTNIVFNKVLIIRFVDISNQLSQKHQHSTADQSLFSWGKQLAWASLIMSGLLVCFIFLTDILQHNKFWAGWQKPVCIQPEPKRTCHMAMPTTVRRHKRRKYGAHQMANIWIMADWQWSRTLCGSYRTYPKRSRREVVQEEKRQSQSRTL